MGKYGEDDSGTSFKQIHFQTYLAATREHQNNDKNIAVITAQGPIVMGEGGVDVAAAETLVSYIREARNNEDTAAILLRVNSPGGSAFASELIRQELVTAQSQGIKVIASMGPMAASGGYWISATADEIWAAPTTITGSIGIFGLVPTFENTLDKVGIHSDGVGTTPLAGAFNTSKSLPDMTKDIIQQMIEGGYERFLALVSQGRGMSRDKVDAIAQGRVWSGAKAHELGLVDHLGGFEDAVKAAANAAEIEDYNVVFYRDRPDELQRLLADLMNSTVGLDIFTPKSNSATDALLKKASELLDETAFLSTLNDPMGSYAICFVCDVTSK